MLLDSIADKKIPALFGGVFIIYTAMKEILHMMVLSDLETDEEHSKSIGMVIFLIVSMNVVFSFDSILSAIALVSDSSSNAGESISSTNFWIMVIAIMTGGGLMIWLADSVSEFLQRNRMYEVLGLFILFVVGILLLSEGGELAHLKLFGNEVHAMSKATFYFVITVLVLTEVVQSRYKKKLLQQQKSLRK